MSRLAPIVLSLPLILQSAQAQNSMSVIHTLVAPEQPPCFFGRSIAFVGDVSGDGVADIVVGDSGFRTYVFSGKTGTLLHTLLSPSEDSDDFGFAVAGITDVTGDAIPDVLVGAPLADPAASPTDAGRVYLFDGALGVLTRGLASPNEEESGRFGYAVAAVGDVDGDGVEDLIVGAPYENPGTSPMDAGRAYVMSGSDGSVLHALASPGEVNGQTGGHFGASVYGPGDMNGDGTPDVLVGAPGEHAAPTEFGPGRVYAFSGATGELLWMGASLDLEDGGGFGRSVSTTGDIDGDGSPDVIVGAPYEDSDSFCFNCGRAYVFSGATGDTLRVVYPPCGERDGQFGFSVSWAGDVDGDGTPDYVVGALLEGLSPQGDDWVGRAHVFSGSSGEALWMLDSPNAWYGGGFGFALAGGCDMTGNGRPEILVGAPSEEPRHAYVFGPEMVLDGQIVGDAVVLSWTPVVGVSQFWVYGADATAYFSPGMGPGYEHRLVVLPPTAGSWSSSGGVGDEAHNWTYVVLAVSSTESEMCRSGRLGEHDFELAHSP